MTARIEIFPNTEAVGYDPRGAVIQKRYACDFAIMHVTQADIYTIDKLFEHSVLVQIAQSLTNPVTQSHRVLTAATGTALPVPFDWAVEIGFLPGVTDNVATTAREIIEDLTGQHFGEGEGVYTSRLLFVRGELSRDDITAFAFAQSNPLIQRVHIKDATAFRDEGGMPFIVPKVQLHERQVADSVDLHLPDDQLEQIGKRGVPNPDGTYRGPLGLNLEELKAIRTYFDEEEGRPPRDIELECLAQTWSEHCKHTIFASPIDEVKEGIFRRYIRGATEAIRERKGNKDICVSVFSDNAGAIVFDEDWLLTDKVETHNSPSALDPFGGAITGIVGVNRDCLGFGMGAKPVLNRYGFCFADPASEPDYYRGPNQSMPMLSPRTIMDGVVHGVNEGGNCSGIPTPQGFAYFDERYAGKPLVYVGTVGLIPRKVAGKPSHEKGAQPGDVIVMLGGRVGKDGIHGATFSSVALDEGSPATAVQIGDPITQKKFSDALVREAREQGLYHAITDNGAGGLSSSIGEMAEQSGGFLVDLDKVPLKYPGMSPWEIWISESQERMTLAVPPENVDALVALIASRGSEATVIGEFTDSGRAQLRYQGEMVMDMSMAFMHDGQPMMTLHTSPMTHQDKEPTPQHQVVAEALPAMLSRLNICSKAFIATQFDHEVQGVSVLKPLQGKGQVFAEATVARPVLGSLKGAVLSQGLAPRYSDIDCYAMAAASIDIAVRNAVAVGASLDHLALCDNFCWCDSTNPERLWQLKKAAEACHDVAVAYGTPYISGKDSMFNDFRGYDADGQPVHVAIPPTLLISALGVMDDVTQAVSLDAKLPGDLIYVLGQTRDELGGSEYYAMQGVLGVRVPQLDVEAAIARYHAYHDAVRDGLVASALAVTLGGLGVALAKSCIAGQLGAKIELEAVPQAEGLNHQQLLFSESLGRLLVTVAPQDQAAFERAIQGTAYACIGEVAEKPELVLAGETFNITELSACYHAPLADY